MSLTSSEKLLSTPPRRRKINKHPKATPTVIDVTKGRVKDLAENYEGRHWAMVYGDHSEEIKNANDVLGIESVII